MTDTRQALEEAWDKIHPMPELSDIVSRDQFLMAMEVSWPARSRFRRFLDAEAWTDAALMLIPTDGSMKLLDIECSYEPNDPGVWSACTIRWYPPHKSGNDWHARIESGPIPALALAQAALRAKEAGDVYQTPA